MELREEFHKLIDSIQDEGMLTAYFAFISQRESNVEGSLYDSLTGTQKKELQLSYEESFVSSNLISHEKIKNQHKKWLQEK